MHRPVFQPIPPTHRPPRKHRSTPPLAAAALSLCLLLGIPIFTPTLHAALIMDESSHSPTSSIGEASGGELTGFEFTTPTGPSFNVGEIKASFFSSNGYAGNTDFRLYTRAGADLTPISTPIAIAGLPAVTPATFNFATHAVTVDFSSQSISLDPTSTYTLLAEHNGGAGNMGIIFAFGAGSGPIVGAGRVYATIALDDAGFEDHNDIVFQIFDAAPVPEPASPLFLAAAALLLARRSRTP